MYCTFICFHLPQGPFRWFSANAEAPSADYEAPSADYEAPSADYETPSADYKALSAASKAIKAVSETLLDVFGVLKRLNSTISITETIGKSIFLEIL